MPALHACLRACCPAACMPPHCPAAARRRAVGEWRHVQPCALATAALQTLVPLPSPLPPPLQLQVFFLDAVADWGFNWVVSDADVVWFKDPAPLFAKHPAAGARLGCGCWQAAHPMRRQLCVRRQTCCSERAMPCPTALLRAPWPIPLFQHSPASALPADLLFSDDGGQSRNEKGDDGVERAGSIYFNFNTGKQGWVRGGEAQRLGFLVAQGRWGRPLPGRRPCLAGEPCGSSTGRAVPPALPRQTRPQPAPPSGAGAYLLRGGANTTAFIHAWAKLYGECGSHDQARGAGAGRGRAGQRRRAAPQPWPAPGAVAAQALTAPLRHPCSPPSPLSLRLPAQLCVYKLIQTGDEEPVPAELGLMCGWHKRVAVGILPTSMFMSAHTLQLQRLNEVRGGAAAAAAACLRG